MLFLFRFQFVFNILVALSLARLAAAQAPAFDMVAYCGDAQTANSFANAQAMQTDAQGNTLVAGSIYGTVIFGSFVLTSHGGVNDAFVAKRSPAGTWLWATSAGGATASTGCTAVAVDALGQVYITGAFGTGSGTASSQATFGSISLTSTGGADVLVAKLDGSTGQWLWATSAGAGTANGTDERGTALATDNLGSVWLTGSFADFRLLAGALTLYQVGTGANLFVAKLDAATGTWAWATNPGPVTSYYLAVDGQGNAYLSGSFLTASLTLGSLTLANPLVSTYTGQSFVAKLSVAGTWAWATPLPGTYGTGTNVGAGGTFAADLAPDGQDHLYVCGVFSGATATFGATTLVNASTTYQGPQIGSVQLGDAFVARLSASTGQWQWAVRAGGIDGEYFTRLTVRNGRLTVGGAFGRQNNMLDTGTPSPGGSDFGGTTLVSAGKYDIVVAGLTDAGQWLWAVRAGSTSQDMVMGLALDASGRVLLLASSDATAQFGALSVAPGYNILARLAGGALPTSPASLPAPFALYPNPARAAVTVSGLPANQPVQVLDALGRVVLTARTPAQGPLELNLPAGLAPSVYMVRAAGQARQLVVE